MAWKDYSETPISQQEKDYRSTRAAIGIVVCFLLGVFVAYSLGYHDGAVEARTECATVENLKDN